MFFIIISIFILKGALRPILCQAPLGPDTALFGNHIPPGTSAQSPNTSISPSTLFDIFDGARRLLEARRGRPDASRVDLGTSPAFGGQ
ncbi:hypothetical protein POSPLADRAFT_1056262 [Postia placenta MAD-698-R-SB12]|uniref:Uncharacterized protein n=1 Tax=Postia placenta MAD-698-R-SB12 TaxID=670580 RepID=A0A1X6N374_9APHY|nr:hypothetical protein POSPLADRAFT_1056262 [Postia placenta MAD-698-R-SB12]OSX62893.1 hypothetical protein POSPLADRAFT_1056262 [Postia placenta MAD-698-R-SB12]